MSNLTTKICTKCERELPATIEFYHRSYQVKSGLKSMCRDCTNEYRRDRHTKVSESLNEHRRIRYAENPEVIKEGVHRFYRSNREKILEQKKEYYVLNRSDIRATRKQRRLINIEAEREKDRIYYENNADRKRANRRLSNKRHRATIRESLKAYTHKRRANGGSFTPLQIRELLEMQNCRCIYCGVDIKHNPTIDHHIAVSQGGSSDITNIFMACKKCNSSKGKKHPFKWYKLREYV